MKLVKNFSGYVVASSSACCQQYNNKVVERTIKKAFPNDKTSTLYIVKVKGVRDHLALYEDEMIKVN
jgi:nitrogen fixation protein FixH